MRRWLLRAFYVSRRALAQQDRVPRALMRQGSAQRLGRARLTARLGQSDRSVLDRQDQAAAEAFQVLPALAALGLRRLSVLPAFRSVGFHSGARLLAVRLQLAYRRRLHLMVGSRFRRRLRQTKILGLSAPV